MAAAAVETATDAAAAMQHDAEGHGEADGEEEEGEEADDDDEDWYDEEESLYLEKGDDGKGGFLDATGCLHDITYVDEPTEKPVAKQPTPPPSTQTVGQVHETLAIGSAANRRMMIHADPLLRDLRYSKTNLEVALNMIRVLFEYNEARHYPFTEDRSKTEKLPVLPFGAETMVDCPYCRGQKHFCPLCGLVQQAFALINLRTAAVPDKRLINQIKKMYYDEYKKTQAKRERKHNRIDAYNLKRAHALPSEVVELDEAEAKARAADAKEEQDAKRASGLPEWFDPYSRIQPRLNTIEEINAAAARQQAIARVTELWKARMKPLTAEQAARRAQAMATTANVAKPVSAAGLPLASKAIREPPPPAPTRQPLAPLPPQQRRVPPGFVAAGPIKDAPKPFQIKEAPKPLQSTAPVPFIIETFRMKRKADPPPSEPIPNPPADPDSSDENRPPPKRVKSGAALQTTPKRMTAVDIEGFVTRPTYIDVTELHAIKNSFTDEMKKGLELLTDTKSNLAVVEAEIAKIASNRVVHKQQTFYYNVIYAKAIHVHRLKWASLNPTKAKDWSGVASQRFGRPDRVLSIYESIGELATRYKRFESINCAHHSWMFIYRHYGGIKKSFALHGESVDKLWNP